MSVHHREHYTGSVLQGNKTNRPGADGGRPAHLDLTGLRRILRPL
jgi:hypothetical protein